MGVFSEQIIPELKFSVSYHSDHPNECEVCTYHTYSFPNHFSPCWGKK